MEESSGIEFGTLLIKHLKNRHKAEKEQEEEDKKNKKKKFIQTFNIISKLRKRKNLENILNPHGAEIKAREPNAFINYDHGAIPGSSSTSSFIKPPPLPSPLKDLGDNLLAALSVSLINLPLCMAFATAGTMPPAVGIMSAFYCSIFIFLSDSKYSIISVPMSIALLSKPLVKSYGYIGYQMALFMSGLMMMGSLMTKLYKYMVVIPKCVMDGFMNGGVLGIFVDQMETIFCLDVNWKQLYDRPGDEFIGIQLVYGMGEVFKQWSNVNYLSAFLYFATIIGLFILMGSHPKQPWVLYVCLMGLAIGVFEGYLVHPDKQMIRLDKRYPKDELRFFSYPEIGSRKFGKMVSNPQFWFDSLSLAMIIMLESLITWGMMEIGTDQRFTSRPRNLFVVVISNLSSLITGSMGAGFVFERSFTNFETGAKSQWACLYQGLFCLSFGFLFFNSFQYIPAVIIDALMMGIQVKTIRFDELLFTYKNDFKLFASNVTVTIAMLFTRGSYSIYIGIFVYLLMFAKELMNPQNELTIAHANEGDEEDDDDKGLRHQMYNFHELEMKNCEFPEIDQELFKDEKDLRRKLQMHQGNKILLYRFVGIMTYLNIPYHNLKLSFATEPFDLLVLSFRYVTMADHDGLLALLDFIFEQEKAGVKIVIVGVKERLNNRICAIGGLKEEFAERSWRKLLEKAENGMLEDYLDNKNDDDNEEEEVEEKLQK